MSYSWLFFFGSKEILPLMGPVKAECRLDKDERLKKLQKKFEGYKGKVMKAVLAMDYSDAKIRKERHLAEVAGAVKAVRKSVPLGSFEEYLKVLDAAPDFVNLGERQPVTFDLLRGLRLIDDSDPVILLQRIEVVKQIFNVINKQDFEVLRLQSSTRQNLVQAAEELVQHARTPTPETPSSETHSQEILSPESISLKILSPETLPLIFKGLKDHIEILVDEADKKHVHEEAKLRRKEIRQRLRSTYTFFG